MPFPIKYLIPEIILYLCKLPFYWTHLFVELIETTPCCTFVETIHDVGNWKYKQGQVIQRDEDKYMFCIVFTILHLDKVRVPKLATASSRYTGPKGSSPAYCLQLTTLSWLDPDFPQSTSLVVWSTSRSFRSSQRLSLFSIFVRFRHALPFRNQ